MRRCEWPGLEKSERYRVYHDLEWGVPSFDDGYLFEMLVLESFHCGLSWLIILNKRESFQEAFDNFKPEIIKEYNESKILELLDNKEIVRHIGKIKATINNAAKFIEIQKEFGTFKDYIWGFTNNEIIRNMDDNFSNKSELSDRVTKDLKKRGFKFMGSVTTQSYLEAIGVIDNHSTKCFRHINNKE